MKWKTIRPFEGEAVPSDLGDRDGVIVMGGPMAVQDRRLHPWISDEINLVKTAVERNMPVLGICLGAQVMAAALGANVYPSRTREIGCLPVTLTDLGSKDPAFQDFQHEFVVFQWHGDTFDMPKNARRLARGIVSPNQAFAVGKRAYALQFHLEVTREMVDRFIEHYPEDLKAAGIESADTMLHVFEAHEPWMRRACEQFVNGFLAAADS
ncbi:MAG: type 1 glutamine amidotransferase [Deltaproteobacteria bacterium]|nr:type 1 glutamine amidotransferase [Deltaproteobacteria bacterium]